MSVVRLLIRRFSLRIFDERFSFRTGYGSSRRIRFSRASCKEELVFQLQPRTYLFVTRSVTHDHEDDDS